LGKWRDKYLLVDNKRSIYDERVDFHTKGMFMLSQYQTGKDIRDLRKSLGLNQSQFWGRIYTTQSGGSRYESGRNIPNCVQCLIAISYGKENEAKALVDKLRKAA
jgi:hypothetical protein